MGAIINESLKAYLKVSIAQPLTAGKEEKRDVRPVHRACFGLEPAFVAAEAREKDGQPPLFSINNLVPSRQRLGKRKKRISNHALIPKICDPIKTFVV
jgi:hypothetical protein